MPIPTPLKVLSLIPPMTQLNTPYPSTAYLTGFLRSRGFDAVQEDLALATVLALLNKKGLTELRDAALALPVEDRSGPVNFFLDHFNDYAVSIDPVIAFLQGRDSTLSHRIENRVQQSRFAGTCATCHQNIALGINRLVNCRHLRWR